MFYASVLLTLIAHDLLTGSPVPARRGVGAAVSFAGIVVLASGSIGTVTVLGVVLLAVAGLAWGLYTAAGRTCADPRVAGMVWAAGMGIGTTALAYVAWYACQRSMSATTAGSVQLVIPVLTTAGAVALLGEELSVTLLLAAALVGTVCGSVALNRPAGHEC